VMDDVCVGFTPWCKDPVDVAETREQLRHAFQGVVRSADVELKLGLGRMSGLGLGNAHFLLCGKWAKLKLYLTRATHE
jgi:hypothetical protein